MINSWNGKKSLTLSSHKQVPKVDFMNIKTTKNVIVAGLVAGTVALAPASGVIAASVANAQASYSPTFSSKEYAKNVNTYADQIQKELAESGKTASDESFSQIFDIPFKDGKAVEDAGYKPTFSSANTGDTAQEKKVFKTRGLELAQQLSDPDLDKAIAKIFGDGTPIDLNNTVAVPEANINPNKQGEEVNQAPKPPVENTNSADNGVASAGTDSNDPVAENTDTAAPSVDNEAEEASEPESETSSPASNNETAPTSDDTSDTDNTAVNNAPTLANTGVSTLGLLTALGAIVTGAGMIVLRKKH